MTKLDFILVSDPQVQGIPINDCNEKLVDIMNLNSPKFKLLEGGSYPGCTFVRETVAEKLLSAAASLPSDIIFLFSEGHRTIEIQKRIFNGYYNKLKNRNPGLSHNEIKVEANKFIAYPEGTPPHSTGGAFDITLCDLEGNEFDMGSPMGELPYENECRNFTAAENISDAGKGNRKILIDALSMAGFANYPAEWWHWSYGDCYWAHRTNSKAAIYASIEAP